MKFVLKSKGWVSRCVDVKVQRGWIDGSLTGWLNHAKPTDEQRSQEKQRARYTTQRTKSRCPAGWMIDC